MTERKEKAESGYVVTYGGDQYTATVEKWEGGSVTASYRVDGGTCTCPGWKHRETCKHVDLVNRLHLRGEQPMPFETAKGIVKEVLAGLLKPDGGFHTVEFVKYERAPDGQVTRALFEAYGDADGTYRGFCKELLVEIRCFKTNPPK